MNKPLWEQLHALGRVLHWLGKYEEMQAVDKLAKWCLENQIKTYAELDNYHLTSELPS